MNGRKAAKKTYPKPEEIIVNDLIKALESGVSPWRKEWSCKGGFRNLLTGNPYKGSNPALLCIKSALSNHWHLPLFIGGGQARSIGCLPKKGSSSARVLQPIQRSFELKEKGSTEPILFDSVTVFFTDFVGFTNIAEKLKPKELVDELDKCFSYFDQVTEKYNLEKLKTIGDAFMAKELLAFGEIEGLVVDGGRFGASHGMCAVLARIEPGIFGPFFHKIGILITAFPLP